MAWPGTFASVGDMGLTPGKTWDYPTCRGATKPMVCISEVIDISPSILIPACASSSTAFLMMYSAYKQIRHKGGL